MNARTLTALPCMLAVIAASASAEEPDSPTAEGMMVRAHSTRATWDGFPGFSADVFAAEDGKQCTGKLTVTASGELSLELSKPFAWVETKLESLVAHRMGTGSDEYNVSFADQEQHHPLGRLIAINDDRLMGSRYRIQDDLIREVHRTTPRVKFTITVLDVVRNPSGRYLPKYYTVSFWDTETGELQSVWVVQDDWQQVGAWDLPTRLLTIESKDAQRTVKDIRLKNHRLLAEKEAAAR